MHDSGLSAQSSPVLSVIVPVYNAENWLVNCLDSLLIACVGMEAEIICIDDGSTDRSCAILEEYERNYSQVFLIRQGNLGRCAARNAGLDRARGAWVTFVDADDSVVSDGFSNMLSSASANGADVVFASYRESASPGIASGRRLDLADRLFDSRSALRLLLDFAYYAKEKVPSGERGALNAHGQLDLSTMWGCLYSGEIIRVNRIRCCDGLVFGEDALFNFDFLSHANNVLYTSDVVYIQNVENEGTIRSYRDGDAERIASLFPQWEKRAYKNGALQTDISNLLGREVMSIVQRTPFSRTAMKDIRMLVKDYSLTWGRLLDEDRVSALSSNNWRSWRRLYHALKRGRFLELYALQKMYAGLKIVRDAVRSIEEKS